MTLLVLPFSMRESINYAIRAKLRGETVVGACSHDCKYKEYCDEFVILPAVYEYDFADKLSDIIKKYDITKFFTPSEMIWQKVNSLNIIEMAEPSPCALMAAEYEAAKKAALPISAVLACSQVHGHMSEEKMEGFHTILGEMSPYYTGPIVEIGSAWGKSLVAIHHLLSEPRKIYAYDTWSSANAIQDTYQEVNEYAANLDWGMMENLCKANAPFVIYNAPKPSVCSVLHIDANHDYKAVKKDIAEWLPLLHSDGWIILDDISWPGVSKAWSEVEDGFHSVFIKGGALFARKV